MNNAEYLIELLKCAVTGSKISEPDADIDFEKIYKIAGKHNVQMTAYYGIKKLKYSLPVEASAKWENMHLHGISRSIRQLAELQNICETFAKEKIVHMPLKGSLIKHMYPSPDMRNMADMDILIKPEDADRVYDIMLGMGYTCEMKGNFHHDVYKKEPIYNIEVHVSLFDEADGMWDSYYKDVLDRTSAGRNEYERVLSHEDFYVYNIAHFAKHFQGGGSGIRSVMDIYIMNNAMPEMNMVYVYKQLEKLGLSDFYKKVTALEKYWFEDGRFSEEIEETAKYVLSSGTYGTVYNSVKNEINKNGRFKGFWFNVFPPLERMKFTFPFLKKMPVFLPFCWVARWFFAIVTKPDKVLRKIKYVVRASREMEK